MAPERLRVCGGRLEHATRNPEAAHLEVQRLEVHLKYARRFALVPTGRAQHFGDRLALGRFRSRGGDGAQRPAGDGTDRGRRRRRGSQVTTGEMEITTLDLLAAEKGGAA